MTYKLTLEQLKSFDPCPARLRVAAPLFDGRKTVSLAAAAKAGDLLLQDLLWIAGRMAATDKTLLGQIVQFARDAAATAQVGPGEPEPYWQRVVVASSAVSSALIQGEPITRTMHNDAYSAWAFARGRASGASSWHDTMASASEAALAGKWAAVAASNKGPLGRSGPDATASSASSAAHWARRAREKDGCEFVDYRAMFIRLLTAPPVVR